MSVGIKEIDKIVKLSKIEVKDEQKPQLAEKISNIISWMAVLNEADTKDVEPLLNVHEIELKTFADEVKDGDIAEEILKNAPAPTYNYFAVPKVIE
jgi:aspartyl-tRNA(Asn)/glutamyl-tRNA(Gln) amidotransferase subunit C